ncbi:phage tail protein [Aggregatibacter actinomycetemcomitans]|uniref:phage tail protein n=1 Tax=Aggregatibacter actinomycetemcomitans TaxID=714 RepID=UPI00197B4D10|nr:phage tail protein [Aggregatibacter actinomycetemcomitans]MBN6079901.1 phage tail protein [Aggregatibacter actinomycetemcomitans]
MAQYSAVFTTYGTQLLAKAIANNKPLTVTHFAVGDGNGAAVTVSAHQERLVNEKHRAAVSAVSLDPRNNKQVIFELTIPENVGGFYIREMGVFDEQNKLVAYANCPESFKPTLASGSGKVQVMRMILLVASSNAVTLTVDDSVIFVTRGQLTPHTITANSANGFDNTGHSHAIDKADTTKAGIVQLTNDTGLDSEKLALTARAGKLLSQAINAVRLALNDYIPNSKKSSRVDSNSAEDVATSAAVKTANDNANGRVSKSGDTMTGALTTPNIETGTVNSSAYLNLSSANGTAFYKTGEGNYLALLQNIGLELNVGLKANKNIITKHHGTGGYHNQFDMQAPFFVDAVDYKDESTFHPFTKGKVRKKGDWGASFSFGYTTKQTGYYENGEFGRGVINLNEDNGAFKNWEFEHNGIFRSAGDVVTSTGRSLNSTIYKEGNPHDIALSWLTDGLKVRVDTTDLGRVVFRHDFQYQKIGNFEIRRYPDGTMIQTYIIYQNDLKDFNDEKSFNWAQAFIDTPIVIPFITTEVNDAHDCGVNILTKSNHATVFYREYEHGHPDQGNVRIQFYAIGRWK